MQQKVEAFLLATKSSNFSQFCNLAHSIFCRNFITLVPTFRCERGTKEKWQ